MKVLIMHHVEPMWESSLVSVAHITFDEYLEDIADHVWKSNYDRVILTRFEDDTAEPDVYWGLTDYISEVHTYDYGWSLDMLTDELEGLEELEQLEVYQNDIYKCSQGNKWVQGGNHSQIVWVADWMFGLRHDDVHICGAFDGECIEDLEIALKAAKVEFNRIESLIV
jgi:hypothetical protein